jgi:Ca-activated chloride channel homolog
VEKLIMKTCCFFRSALGFLWMLMTLTTYGQFAITSESYDRDHLARTGQQPVQVNLIYRVSQLLVNADIHNQVARVNVTQTIQNVTGQELEIELLFPLPASGAVQDFVLMVDGKEVPGNLLPRDEARTIFEGIVRRKKDPALMEYAGYGLYRTSVFPVPARGSRTIALKYTIVCSQKGGHVQFIYPFGTQKFSNERIGKVQLTANITADQEVRNVFSPSHQILLDQSQSKRTTVQWTENNSLPMQDFKLYYTPSDHEVSITMMSHKAPDATQGSFLVLITPDIKTRQEQRMPKDVVIAIDKSSSMSGEKMNQARKAAEFVLQNLNEGDRFNLIMYESSVSNYKMTMTERTPQSIRDAVSFVKSIQASGGTNIHDALVRSLAYADEGKGERPFYLLFLTDGVPTVGNTNEAQIADAAKRANKHNAKIYSFGVGYDVNARLLNRLSNDHGGSVTFVKPGENLEVAVSEFYKSIQTPLLTDINIAFSAGVVTEVYPVRIPDFFAGGQIEIAGRYLTPGKGKITVTGKSYGETRKFVYDYTLSQAGENPEYAHIETIWATRKIGYLIDQIDLQGRIPELITSLTELSLRYGILTPYTSFLAREDVNLYDVRQNTIQTTQQLHQLESVSGVSAVNQRQSKAAMKENTRSVATGAAEYSDVSGKVQTVETVKNVGGRAFYYRNNQWVDGTLTEKELGAAKEVRQFSDEWFALSRQNSSEMNALMSFNQQVAVKLNGEVYRIVP